MSVTLLSVGLMLTAAAATTGGMEAWRRNRDAKTRLLRRQAKARRPRATPSKGFRSIRERVPRGDIVVHWTNRDGSRHMGDAVNVSMKGIYFESTDFDSDGIDLIASGKYGLNLVVRSSIVIRHADEGVAMMLVEFEDDENAWISWIELMTRIG